MSANPSGDGAHILVFPFPTQGHMLPLLDLTHQLAIRSLTITILVTPNNLPFLHPLLSKHPSIQNLVFLFPHHPSLPPSVENVKDIGNRGNTPIIRALSALSDLITQWFNTHPSPPVAILSDFFLGWTQHLTHRLGVPRIAFYSFGAFLASILGPPTFPFLSLQPPSPFFPYNHLPSIIHLYRESDSDWQIVKDGMITNSSSWGCILNTFDALEGVYLDHLKKEMGHHRVWGVGPLAVMEGAGVGARTDERGRPSSVSPVDVLEWLDRCLDESVLYVCFGSQVLLPKRQLEALGAKLERSGVRFIWTVIIKEIEDWVAGRGLNIRGWAPQVPILNHGAMGRFLTHYGWNLVMEGIMAGVLLLTWPREAD
uniref:UDP-glycosyltransferase 89A2-like n=1 Tax=Nelumbo nucifera TaxID=4432 RepID=A0A822YH31_NELNU|nr:TPA_asm: hypothetical protein HUJ06_010668 [Nelumbo nucifera]